MKLIKLFCAAIAVAFGPNLFAEEVQPQALVVQSASSISKSLADDVRIAGYDVRSAEASALNDSAAFNGVSLLVISDARALPDNVALPIEKFLKAGGHMIAAGLPAWQNSATNPTNFPNIQAFSPNYMFYPVTGNVQVSTPSDIGVVTAIGKPMSLANNGDLWAMHPRPRSVGY